eukprot:89603-Chlamydomonas_euryale.AAC.1
MTSSPMRILSPMRGPRKLGSFQFFGVRYLIRVRRPQYHGVTVDDLVASSAYVIREMYGVSMHTAYA